MQDSGPSSPQLPGIGSLEARWSSINSSGGPGRRLVESVARGEALFCSLSWAGLIEARSLPSGRRPIRRLLFVQSSWPRWGDACLRTHEERISPAVDAILHKGGHPAVSALGDKCQNCTRGTWRVFVLASVAHCVYPRTTISNE